MKQQQQVFREESRRPLVVQTSYYKGEHRLDIRYHYWKDGELRPTRKGISLRMQEPAGGDPCYSLAHDVIAGALSVNGEALKFDTSAREPLVVRSTVYKGQPRVDIRRHYWKDGELRPGRRGVSLPVQDEFATQVLESALDMVIH